jgi:hypothetical protein
MRRRILFYVVAWLLVPLAFATFVNISYGNALRYGALPFLGLHALRWWTTFAVALMLGGACMFFAHRRARLVKALWPIAYVIVMGVVLAGIHLAIACRWGDCL